MTIKIGGGHRIVHRNTSRTALSGFLSRGFCASSVTAWVVASQCLRWIIFVRLTSTRWSSLRSSKVSCGAALFADIAPLKAIELVVLDFDGVLTDNTLFVDESGHESVRCNRSDGLGIAALRRGGKEVIVFSTEENPVVAARCAKLKITCHQGLADKAAYLRDYLSTRHISPDNVLFLGNDVNDLGCLALVGMPVVVADAHPAAVAKARLVLTRKGGDGAVRELCDLLLSSRGQE